MKTLDLPQPGHFPRLPLPGSGPGLEPCSTARLQPRYWSERFFVPVTVKTDQETPWGRRPWSPCAAGQSDRPAVAVCAGAATFLPQALPLSFYLLLGRGVHKKYIYIIVFYSHFKS